MRLYAQIEPGRRVTWENGELSGSLEDIRALRMESVTATLEGVAVGHFMGPQVSRDFVSHHLGFIEMVYRLWPDAEIVWTTPEPEYLIPEGAIS